MISNLKTVIQIFRELNYILNNNQKKRSMIVLSSVIFCSFFELLGVTAVLPFIQAVTNPEVLMKNTLVSRIMKKIGLTTSKELLIMMGVFIICVYIIKNAFMVVCCYIQNDFASRVQNELSIEMLTSYLKRPYPFFLDVNSADLIRGCNGDTGGVYQILSNIFIILSELLSVLLISAFIIITDPWTALGIVILMTSVMLGLVFFFKPLMKEAGEKSRSASREMSKSLIQIIHGIKELFVMQRKDEFVQEYVLESNEFRIAQRTNTFVSGCPDRIIEGICVSGLIGVICIRLMVKDNMIEFIPQLGAFAMAAFKVLPSIGKITSRANNLVFFRPTLESVYNNIKEVKLFEQEQSRYIVSQEDGIYKAGIDSFEHQLSVCNVLWKYEKAKSPVLDGISISVMKGESIALIGESGAGKTTLADVILGLLKPQKGFVSVDGIDVYSIPKQWAKIVGYVPQSVYLVDDSVKRNVAFGIPCEKIDDNAVWDAIERAQLKDYISSLPNGIDTVVGERGVKFSGGQKQRIAIARALYTNPEILILDEATAALDNETEAAVMESIEKLQGQVTLIIVAHRLTTIKMCDRIYEVKSGKAIERKKEDVLGVG